MHPPRSLGRFSFGFGDRFGRQAHAQLQACRQTVADGVDLIPVWNKSHREHRLIGTAPASTRAAADAAVQALGWTRSYFVDADHIRRATVDEALAASDFFTIDVAESIGQRADPAAVAAFRRQHPELVGSRIEIAGLDRAFALTEAELERIAAQYLRAVQAAGELYRHIAQAKDPGTFVTEVSLDETEQPQTPPELLVILAALADEQVPLATIAPKFTGRFNKGVDYAGAVAQFEREFSDDVRVLAHAVQRYGLPPALKLSIHSGSDKFSLYPALHRALARLQAGVHVKTAGTSWLEEVIGLAESGGEGLALAKELYARASARVDELCAPYATVLDLDRARLPSVGQVQRWGAEEYVRALRHDPLEVRFNPHLRQLLHVSFKVAAEMGDRYLDQLVACASVIARNVTGNLLERHLRPIFLGLTTPPSPSPPRP